MTDIAPQYRHTQIGYVTLATLGGGVVAAAGLRQLHVATTLLYATGAFILVMSALFSSLTITVSDAQLESHFTFGFWRKRVPLAEIAGVSITRSTWLEGWGIRVTTRGMLYNVSGTRAVEVELRSGRRFRLGTDEPEALSAAIRATMRGPNS
jgi:hypothetical protein